MENNSQLIQMFRTIDTATLLELAVIVAGAIVIAFLTRKVLSWLAERLHGKGRLILMAAVPLIRLVIIIAAILLVVPRILEPSVQNMVALLGTLGVALGFAFKDYVGSLLAGVVAVTEKPYRNGDWVRIGDVYGEVRHIGMRAMDIVTADDDRVSIPHSKMWTEPIFNANDGEPSLQCVADFYLHPEHDGSLVRETLRDVALTSPYLRFGEPIAVIVHEERWGTHYKLRAYPVDAAQQYRFVSDLTIRGKTALMESGARFSNCLPGGGDIE